MFERPIEHPRPSREALVAQAELCRPHRDRYDDDLVLYPHKDLLASWRTYSRYTPDEEPSWEDTFPGWTALDFHILVQLIDKCLLEAEYDVGDYHPEVFVDAILAEAEQENATEAAERIAKFKKQVIGQLRLNVAIHGHQIGNPWESLTVEHLMSLDPRIKGTEQWTEEQWEDVIREAKTKPSKD